MLFTWDILVETGHTATNKKKQPLKVAHGIITFVSVQFPTGCHGMVHCKIFHFSHQIFPSVEDMSMIGDGAPVEWTEYYEMYQEPYELRAELWGVGCSYDHTVTIRVAVLPRKAVIATSIVDAMRSALGMLSPRRIFTRKMEERE